MFIEELDNLIMEADPQIKSPQQIPDPQSPGFAIIEPKLKK